MRIAFFGGTFDPPHLGHVAEARAALAAGATDRVWFAPAWAPPHKRDSVISPFADRTAMLELALAGESGMSVCRIEEELRLVPSYTFEVLSILAGRRPEDRFQLLIGGDSLAQLHGWHRAPELVRRFEVLTYPRRGETPDLAQLRSVWPEDSAQKLAAGILDAPFFELSSTEVRKKVENCENLATVLAEQVSDYIIKKRLYRKENMKQTAPNPAEMAAFCAKLAEDKLAENVTVIEIGSKSSIADYFVICTATSEPHMTALSGHIERAVREQFGLRTISHGDAGSSGWMLLDFISVIVHVMTREVRERYSLESLWGGAPDAAVAEKMEKVTRARQ
ncbi:MAG: nicotinate (nicotinamide) nucleotide adenylyltransferase [Victivallaceae bacterium]